MKHHKSRSDGGRVVAGTARGLRLDAPPAGTRPLTDRVKESLFAALDAAGSLDGPFLDLFAGSGAGGVEALSRGAPSATFVEHDGVACAVIGTNVRRAHVDDRSNIVRADALSFLHSGAPAQRTPFSGALVDPPYGDQILERVLELLADDERRWLTPDAIVVAKHFWKDEQPETVGRLERTRQRRFGETMLSFYMRSQATDHGSMP